MSSKNEELSLIKWQKRLLPLMVLVILALTLFFLIFSFLHLRMINNRIRQDIDEYLKLDKKELFAQLSVESQTNFQNILEATRLKTILTLEIMSLERSYHQASISMMSVIWSRYLGFLTGMVLALIGSIFILGKLNLDEDSMSALDIFQKVRLYFKSASPGLFIAFLGVILMVAAIVKDYQVVIEKSPIYASNITSYFSASHQGQETTIGNPVKIFEQSRPKHSAILDPEN